MLFRSSGRGFRISKANQTSFFNEIIAVDYTSMVRDFLKSKPIVTNQNLFDFGLENGFMPTHTKKVLDEMKANGQLADIISLDGVEARGYYIDDNHNRKVQIKLK